MARMPASVTNIIFRFAERGDGGAAGASTRSRPPVIDLANNRLRGNFILPIRLDGYCSKFLASAGLHRRHGYRRAPGGPCHLIMAWIQRVSVGVRVKFR